MTHKYVYLFSEGDASMRNLLGGKGANLAEMTKLGLPVPQGFTITTEACTRYYDDDRQINADIQAQIDVAVLDFVFLKPRECFFDGHTIDSRHTHEKSLRQHNRAPEGFLRSRLYLSHDFCELPIV